MRTDLDEHPTPIPQQRPRSTLKLNRLTQIAIPILTIQLTSIQQTTSHSREKRHTTRPRLDTSTPLQQLPPNTLNLRRMSRIINRNLPRPHTITHTLPKKTLQSTTLTRHNNRRRTIHRRHTNTTTPTPKTLLHLTNRPNNRHHPTQPSQPHKRPTTQRHHPRPILQRQTTSHNRSSNLTLRMTNHHPRTNTTLPPQPRQRHHHRPQHRLNHIHTIQPRLTLNTTQHTLQRPINKPRQRPLTITHQPSKHTRTIQQTNSHTNPLRTLTRKHKHRTTTNTTTHHHTRNQPNTRHPTTQRRKTPQQPLTIPTNHHRPMLKHRTRNQRQTNIPHRNTRLTLHKPTQTPSLSTQRTHTPTRQNPRQNTTTNHATATNAANVRHHRIPRHRDPSRQRRLRLIFLDDRRRRRLLQDHVRVGTTNPKRGHPRPPRITAPLPHPLLSQKRNPTTRPIHMRRRRINMQRPRQHTMTHRHHHLDHTRHTSSRLSMTNIRLHRPKPQRTIRSPADTIRPNQRLRLNRITQRRTRTMPLNHIHLPRTKTSTRQRLPNHPLLRRTIRRRQPVRSTILINGTTPHQTQHLTTTTNSIRQTLQQHHANTLGPTGSVGGIGKGSTATVRRQAALTRELDEQPRRGQDRDSSGQRQRTLTGTQRLTSQMQRHKRRRTRRVNRHSRTLQTKDIRHPARPNTA